MAAALLLLAAGCASWQERAPADKLLRPDGETWLYYPHQPFGRKVFVVRFAADGKQLAVEQRLSEEFIAQLVPHHSRKEDVRALFGAPYEASHFPRMEREVWSWHMRRWGDMPVGLHVQMSLDGVVREIYILDESQNDRWRFLR